jgi:hypothetical protein
MTKNQEPLPSRSLPIATPDRSLNRLANEAKAASPLSGLQSLGRDDRLPELVRVAGAFGALRH